MLIAVICIYMGVWGCAYCAAQAEGGVRFAAMYAVAVLVLPALFGVAFWLIYQRVDAEGAGNLTRLVILIGAGLGLVFYPLIYLRTRRDV
ncbi:hypothetical protein [Roseovarius sp.]|uniref:hypothetical protein n=1 Tax=Roseovarius sp. TaxID=1486281 RepID=UPI003BAAD30F